MSAPASDLPIDPAPVRRSRALMAGIVVYLGLLIGAFASDDPTLDELAAFALVSVALLPALRNGRVSAWVTWILVALAFAWLAHRGHGRLALDALPIFVNVALCVFFARTLMRNREPLIARIIALLEGPERLALPRVGRYARALTGTWAILFAAQACVLSIVVVCSVPDGVLAALGIASPLAIAPPWRWYLHLGSYLLVIAFLVGEYAIRRWYLRHIPHAPLSVFIAGLGRRWPALLEGFTADASRPRR